MWAVILIVVLAAVFTATGIAMLFGKGSFLIAGYNMMSDDEKAVYDTRKLCRVTGLMMLVIAVMLGVMAVLGYRVEAGALPEDAMLPFAGIFIAVVLIAVIAAIILMTTYCKKK